MNTQQQLLGDLPPRLADFAMPLRLDEWLADPLPNAQAEALCATLAQRLHGRRMPDNDRFDLGLRQLLCRNSLGLKIDSDLASLQKMAENDQQFALVQLISGQIAASRKQANASDLLQRGLDRAHHLLDTASYRHWLLWLGAVRKIQPPKSPLTTPLSLAALCTEAGVITQLEAAHRTPIRPGVDRSSDPYDMIG